MRVFESFASQQFSLPHPIINYVLKSKQSSKVCQKLIQTCKYFFAKNPVIVVDGFSAWHGKYSLETEKGRVNYCNNNEKGKFWICKYLDVSNEKNQISKLLPKIYKCDIHILNLRDQTIPYKEYLQIIGKGSFESISLFNINIIFDNGALAPLEAVIETLSDVKKLSIYLPENSNHWFTSQTIEKLINFSGFNNLVKFELNEIPASFDLEAFGEFIKKHRNSKISLWFAQSISRNDARRLRKIKKRIVSINKKDYWDIKIL